MKIKNTFIYLALLSNIFCFAQTNQGTTITSYLPNVTPPSPESFAITEFGRNNISEYKGKPSLTIPIYNYKVGNIQIPISLNYNSAGVKVNDIATWTGMNWVLTIGNVINRTVKDGADEDFFGNRVFINESTLLNSTNSNCSPNSQEYYNLCQQEQTFDTQVDVFNYSIPGSSGSFYLDQNLNPIIINDDNENKILVDGDFRVNKKFIITATNGMKYFFGGNEVEYTRTLSGSRRGSILVPTSFYLYKITDPINGVVFFEYETLPSKINLINKIYTSTIDAYSAASLLYPTFDYSFFRTEIQNPKYLSRISNNENSEEIIFFSTTTTETITDIIKVLDRISVNKNGSVFKKIEFNYLYGSQGEITSNINSSERFFLQKIDIDKDINLSNNKYETYRMTYDDPIGLPARLSNSQDIQGFYNGKTNVTLIPFFETSGFTFASQQIFGNRHPDFDFASKGTLTYIYYPTGGYTKFDYESFPSKKAIYESFGGNVDLNRNGELNILDNYLPRISSLDVEGINGTMMFNEPILNDEIVNIKISTSIDVPHDHINQYIKVQLTITNLTTTVSENFIQKFNLNNQYSVIPYLLKGGNSYSMSITIINTNPNFSIGGDYFANFSFKTQNGYQREDGFGVRLKRMSDYSTLKTNIKRFYYYAINQDENNLDKYPEIKLSPKFSYSFRPDSSGLGGLYLIIHSEGVNKYCDPQESDKVYTTVTTSYGGDLFENGGVEKYFSFKPIELLQRIVTNNDGFITSENGCTGISGINSYVGSNSTNSTIFRAIELASSDEYTDNSTYNGTLVHERFFKKTNGSLFKTKEVTYNYDQVERNRFLNLIARPIDGVTQSNTNGFHCVSDCSDTEKFALYTSYLAYFFTKSFKQTLNSVITKEYINGVPMTDYYTYPNPYDESVRPVDIDIIDNSNTIDLVEQPYKKITTIQEFTYGSLKGLPTEIKTTSSDGTVLLTKNYYPNQTSSLINVFPTEVISSNKLLIQNRVATPIQVEQYRGTDKLSTQRTVYNSWNNNLDMVLPEKILMSKGIQPLEERVVFTEYDTKGNPTIVSLKDGTKTKYFYNSLNQVILKVENYLTTQNIPAVPTWSNACTFITSYSTAMVTIYNYDAVTNQITSIVSPNCDITYYDYDLLHQLKSIRDKNGNLVQEFDHNYKP